MGSMKSPGLSPYISFIGGPSSLQAKPAAGAVRHRHSCDALARYAADPSSRILRPASRQGVDRHWLHGDQPGVSRWQFSGHGPDDRNLTDDAGLVAGPVKDSRARRRNDRLPGTPRCSKPPILVSGEFSASGPSRTSAGDLAKKGYCAIARACS